MCLRHGNWLESPRGGFASRPPFAFTAFVHGDALRRRLAPVHRCGRQRSSHPIAPDPTPWNRLPIASRCGARRQRPLDGLRPTSSRFDERVVRNEEVSRTSCRRSTIHLAYPVSEEPSRHPRSGSVYDCEGYGLPTDAERNTSPAWGGLRGDHVEALTSRRFRVPRRSSH